VATELGLQAKESFFGAEAHWWQSKDDNENMEYGHEVGRLREALRLLEVSSTDLEIAKTNQSQVSAALAKQAKLLQQVYTDKRETKAESLPEIPEQCLVKLDIPLPDFESAAIRGPDLFGDLLPLVSTSSTFSSSSPHGSVLMHMVERWCWPYMPCHSHARHTR